MKKLHLNRGSWFLVIALIATFIGAGILTQSLQLAAVANAQTRQADRAGDPTALHASSRAGEDTFASTCAGCHGLDGQGTGRAPSIVNNAKVQNLSDDQISRIISNGVPGTGMPAFRTLSQEKVREIVGYLRILQGKGGPRSLPGDAARGKEIFFGKGECSACHSMHGAGGFLGPDLTAYAETKSPQAILDTILSANRNAPTGYRSAIVTTRNGGRVEGLIRNEDNFSLQLQTRDGSFHFFQKSDVQNVDYSTKPLMPTNYRERLSPGELDDLVNFLMNSHAKKSAQAEQEDELEEPH